MGSDGCFFDYELPAHLIAQEPCPVRDESRLGAGARLTVALDDMLAAGVDVWYYANGERCGSTRPSRRSCRRSRLISIGLPANAEKHW